MILKAHGGAAKLLLVGTLTALMTLSCGSTTSSAAAKGFSSTTMAQGDYPNTDYSFDGKVVYTASTVRMYDSVVDFPQPVGEKAPLPSGHVHPSGFVVGLTGVTQVDLDDGTHVTVTAGQAIFAPPFVHHSHENPGPGPDDWLFLGPRTEAVRNMPLPSPSAVDVFNSETLPPLTPNATYVMRLDKFTIAPGGQSATVKQGGPTMVYVLDGNDSLHRLNGATEQLGFGHAAFISQGTTYQLRNSSTTDQTHVLVMTMWLKGQPSSTIVNTSLP